MDKPKDDAAETEASRAHTTDTEIDPNPRDDAVEERTQREEQVRRKLQQMFGDDSPQTVRHFLTDLARDSMDEDLPASPRHDDLLDSKPN